ncbi:MAG TPA: hypothetical protein VIF83_02455 [Gemmatimonadaceae bacterium]|jgi:hypothetical protein
MPNPERVAGDYAMLFALGIVGMFVAHLLAFVAFHAKTGVQAIALPYWWGYPLVFPALASIWIHLRKSFWLTTAIVVCLAPTLYFSWYAANSIQSSLGTHPFIVLFGTFALTCIISYMASRGERAAAAAKAKEQPSTGAEQ